MKKQIFNQPSFNAEQLTNLLIQRGLVVSDDRLIKHFLKTIGYCRLKPYFQQFLKEKGNSELGFINGTTFSSVLGLYNFDRELRLLMSDAIERIEVTLRTALSDSMSNKYGPHWYLQPSFFISEKLHQYFLREVFEHLERSKEHFIQDYYSLYHSPEHPPSWMIMECLSFGTVSKAYSNIKDRKIRKEVGDIFGQFSETLKSWMKSLTYTRNLCAHHARLWNRFFVNKPCQVNIKSNYQYNKSPFSMQAYVIIKLLDSIAPGNYWKNRLLLHFEEHESLLSFESMGFQQDWPNDPFWEL